jgi:hypothetical protein
LIFGVGLFALIWQPGFEQGVISIKIMDSYVGYSLWGFFAAALLLVAFIYLFARAFRTRPKQAPAYIAPLLIGTVFIFLLNNITYGWTSYPSLSSLGKNQLTVDKYTLILLSIQGVMVIGMVFLLLRWLRLKNNSVNTGQSK